MCLELPESVEGSTSTGPSFLIRRRIFAHLLGVEEDGQKPANILVCRADPFERTSLAQSGHPFFAAGTNRLGVILGAGTDWSEVKELVVESYRLVAPRRLADSV